MSKNKKVIFNPEALDYIIEGANLVANSVKVTLGPKGKNVILVRDFGKNHVTKDGVTVAKDIRSSIPEVEVGCQLIRDIANKTNDEVGDGTTTSVILAQSIIQQGRNLLNSNCNTTELLSGMKLGLETAIKFIRSKSTKVTSSADINRIAVISANNDKSIGGHITKALDFVGLSGVITVDNSKLPDTSVTLTDGTEIDRGFLSPRFINNDLKNSCELENVKILVTSKDLVDGRELIPILKYCIESKSSLLIIANSISGDILQFLLMNTTSGNVKTCVVNPPSFGEDRFDVMKDVASLTSSTFIDKFENSEITIDKLGMASKVIVTKDNTTIIDGNRSSQVEDRLALINKSLEDETLTKLTKDLLISRKGRLEGKMAVINVGGGSEVEQAELRDRVDDALCATKVAIESGWVPGAGLTLYAASLELHNSSVSFNSEGEKEGFKLVENALKAPLVNLCKNCDISQKQVVDYITADDFEFGVDFLTGMKIDSLDRAVIDPTNVPITALSNAVSIAGTILTTDCIVCNDK